MKRGEGNDSKQIQSTNPHNLSSVNKVRTIKFPELDIVLGTGKDNDTVITKLIITVQVTVTMFIGTKNIALFRWAATTNIGNVFCFQPNSDALL